MWDTTSVHHLMNMMRCLVQERAEKNRRASGSIKLWALWVSALGASPVDAALV